jgi:hypothetical protein
VKVGYQRDELRELGRVAVEHAADHQPWFPGKWVAIRFLRRAMDDDRCADELSRRRVELCRGDADPSPPTLAALVVAVFDVVLLIWGPALPFGGELVRLVMQFVLTHLEHLRPVAGLRYGSIR